MNKQELIGKLRDMRSDRKFEPSLCASTVADPYTEIIRYVEQLDEPKEVKVPAFIGRWIEEVKQRGCGLADALNCFDSPIMPEDVKEWLEFDFSAIGCHHDHQELLAKAWSNDYVVEEVAEWIVRVKDMYFLNWGEDGTCPTFVIDDNPGAKLQAKPFIKSEGQALAVSLKGSIEKV